VLKLVGRILFGTPPSLARPVLEALPRRPALRSAAGRFLASSDVVARRWGGHTLARPVGGHALGAWLLLAAWLAIPVMCFVGLRSLTKSPGSVALRTSRQPRPAPRAMPATQVVPSRPLRASPPPLTESHARDLHSDVQRTTNPTPSVQESIPSEILWLLIL